MPIVLTNTRLDVITQVKRCVHFRTKDVKSKDVTIQPLNGYSIHFSTLVRVNKKGSKPMTKGSIEKGYKRIISGTKLLDLRKTGGKWSPPRAKDLKGSEDGMNWAYLGDNDKWYKFIVNGALFKDENCEYMFVDAIDTIPTH
jgi:hypothetical protein